MDTSERMYLLCLNEEAKLLYEDSIDKLLESDCFDFMVFQFTSGNNKLLSEIEEWEYKYNVDKQTFTLFHRNLCQKLRAQFNKTEGRKKGRRKK